MCVVGIEVGAGAAAAVLSSLVGANGLEHRQELVGIGDSGDGDDHCSCSPWSARAQSAREPQRYDFNHG